MNKQESQEHYHSYAAELRRSSGQSACPAAGCQTDADQGIRYAVVSYTGDDPLSGQVIACQMEPNHAVARGPADAGVLDGLLKQMEMKAKTCGVLMEGHATCDEFHKASEYLVAKRVWESATEMVRKAIQNQAKKSG